MTTITRPCGYCDGLGAVIRDDEYCGPCPCCHGEGVIRREINPLLHLESAMEHVQAVRTSMRLQRRETYKPKPGTPAYHLDAAEDYLAALFQDLAVMLEAES